MLKLGLSLFLAFIFVILTEASGPDINEVRKLDAQLPDQISRVKRDAAKKSNKCKGKKCKSAVNSKPAGRRPRRHSVMHYFINFLPRLDWQDEMCIQATKARLETGSCREEVCRLHEKFDVMCLEVVHNMCKRCAQVLHK